MIRQGPSGFKSLLGANTKFLTGNEIKLLNARVEGPARTNVREEGSLHRAVYSPMYLWSNGQVQDVNQLAAALELNLLTNPVFAGGNKRTAFLAAGLFRLQNGMRLAPDAHQAESNRAIVEAYQSLVAGSIDRAKFSEVCGRSWIVHIDGDQPKTTYGLLKNGPYSKGIAILLSENKRLVHFLVGGRPFNCIILDKRVGRLLGGQGETVVFHDHHDFAEGHFGLRSLGSPLLHFPPKNKAFEILGPITSDAKWQLLHDEALDHSVISSIEGPGLRMWSRVSKLAETFHKALRDMD